MGVVTRTSTCPTAWGGVVVVIVVALTTVKFGRLMTVPPIVTDVAPVKFCPVMVTAVPPAIGPVGGLIAVKIGRAAYVYRPAPVPVPPGVVTATSTRPAAWAGVVAVIWVELLTTRLVAAVPPIVTDVAPVKLVPVMTTD